MFKSNNLTVLTVKSFYLPALKIDVNHLFVSATPWNSFHINYKYKKNKIEKIKYIPTYRNRSYPR